MSFIQQTSMETDETFSLSHEGIINYISSNLNKIKLIIIDHKSKIEVVENDISTINQCKNEIVDIASEFSGDIVYSNDIVDIVNNELDKTYRYKAFRLSTHYYEGRWLQEAEKDLRDGIEYKKTLKSRSKQWRKHAKLTPCFVSTFYMIPKFMEHGKYIDKKTWIGEYLMDFIDLLVVDEAGQASPEVCLPLFALAKKTILVGDVKQIEPVWSVEGFSDYPNIEKYIPSIGTDDFVSSDSHSSNGNLMKIAKRRSNHTKFNEGGLYLTEHRRCVPEVINYCNELAYKGKLIPMRENDHNEFPYEHMLHLNFKGECTTEVSSKKNVQEAIAIADWIVNNHDTLIGYYKDRDKNKQRKKIEEIVAVVTPFKAQANAIKKALHKNEGFGKITVGTVHSLQGAERNIVLFSTVYTSDNQQEYFFDRGVNMLNVAVSRAKDAFIVVGDKDILKPGTSDPSSILSKYLIFNEYQRMQTDLLDFIN